MIVPTVTVSGCLFHGVRGFCVSVRVPLQLFLSCRFQSGICQSSLTGALLLIGHCDQCSCGFVQVFCVLSSYVFVISCVCMTHDVCVVLGSSLLFLVFLYVDRKKRFVIFILSQQEHWHRLMCHCRYPPLCCGVSLNFLRELFAEMLWAFRQPIVD